MPVIPVRWGILSTANIGRKAVIPAIHRSGNGVVSAVASRTTERAQRFAAENGIPAFYGSYEELIASPDIDAVYNPLPNSLHREWTRRALESGKPVLCEKPLCLNAEECLELHDTAVAARLPCMEAFMYRFHPRIVRTLDLIRAGEIGEIQSIYSRFTFQLTRPENVRWLPEFGGGALRDVGCYCVNVSRTIANAEPVEVSAGAVWSTTGVDERLEGTLRFATGFAATFECSLTMDRIETVAVAGAEGILSFDRAFVPGPDPVSITHTAGAKTVRHEVRGADQYQAMVEHFADCVLNGVGVRYPLTEAAANQRTIDALYRSARTGGHPEKV